MDGDRANMYDHIDASHRTLADRIDHLDHRAAQQIYALDKLTRERIDADHLDFQDRMEKRFLRERLETDRQVDRRNEHLRSEIKAWVDSRLSNFEQKHGGKFHADCSDDLIHGRNHKHSQLFLDDQPGALYRSKSDETLSMSSGHPGKKQSRLYARAMHDLKKMRAAEHKMDKRTRGLAVRDRPSNGVVNGHCARPMTFHEDLSPIAGRSPEGHSGHGDYSEYNTEDSIKFNSTSVWSQSQRKYNEAEGKSPSDSSSSQKLQTNFSNLKVHDEPPRSTPYNTSMDSHKTSGLSDKSHMSHSYNSSKNDSSILSEKRPPPNSFTMASFNDDYSNGGFNLRHLKTDTGSIPDSGYGSKRHYGGRPGSIGQDGMNGDNHNSSMGTTVSSNTDGSSPTTFNSTSEGGSDALPLSPQYYNDVSGQMDKYYKQRLADAEKKVDDRMRKEMLGSQSKNNLSKTESSQNIRMNPAIASRMGTEV